MYLNWLRSYFILVKYLKHTYVKYSFSYKENAQKSSQVFSDLPTSALNTAAYWVEYVVRHGRDYKSFQTHNLNWYQYFVLDVLLLFIIVSLSIMLFLYVSIKYFKSKCVP